MVLHVQYKPTTVHVAVAFQLPEARQVADMSPVSVYPVLHASSAVCSNVVPLDAVNRPFAIDSMPQSENVDGKDIVGGLAANSMKEEIPSLSLRKVTAKHGVEMDCTSNTSRWGYREYNAKRINAVMQHYLRRRM